MRLIADFVVVAARFSGCPTLSQVELQTQAWYFIFQVVQVFLIASISNTPAYMILSKYCHRVAEQIADDADRGDQKGPWFGSRPSCQSSTKGINFLLILLPTSRFGSSRFNCFPSSALLALQRSGTVHGFDTTKEVRAMDHSCFIRVGKHLSQIHSFRCHW